MKVVYKYHLGFPMGELNLPVGAEPVHVALQSETIMLWAEVDPNVTSTSKRAFKIFGTGHNIPMESTYIGTVHHDGFVWHVYEVMA